MIFTLPLAPVWMIVRFDCQSAAGCSTVVTDGNDASDGQTMTAPADGEPTVCTLTATPSTKRTRLHQANAEAGVAVSLTSGSSLYFAARTIC